MMLIVQLIPSRLSWRSRDEEKNFDQKPAFDVNQQPGRRGLRIFQFWFDDAFNAWWREERGDIIRI